MLHRPSWSRLSFAIALAAPVSCNAVTGIGQFSVCTEGECFADDASIHPSQTEDGNVGVDDETSRTDGPSPDVDPSDACVPNACGGCTSLTARPGDNCGT